MCHVSADALAGRPSVDYNAIDFFCSRCRADPTRLPRPKPPPAALPPAPLPVAVVQQPIEPILVKEKRKYKPRAQKLGEDGLPLPPAKKQKKVPVGSLQQSIILSRLHSRLFDRYRINRISFRQAILSHLLVPRIPTALHNNRPLQLLNLPSHDLAFLA